MRSKKENKIPKLHNLSVLFKTFFYSDLMSQTKLWMHNKYLPMNTISYFCKLHSIQWSPSPQMSRQLTSSINKYMLQQLLSIRVHSECKNLFSFYVGQLRVWSGSKLLAANIKWTHIGFHLTVIPWPMHCKHHWIAFRITAEIMVLLPPPNQVPTWLSNIALRWEGPGVAVLQRVCETASENYTFRVHARCALALFLLTTVHRNWAVMISCCSSLILSAIAYDDIFCICIYRPQSVRLICTEFETLKTN